MTGDFAPEEHVQVPIDRGTLVVYSNYQLVHRVLRMEITPAVTALERGAKVSAGCCVHHACVGAELKNSIPTTTNSLKYV